MSEAKGGQEPSMEEILASIRRIIAEDNDAPAEEGAAEEPAPAPAPPPAMAMAPPPVMDEPFEEPGIEEDVLELTEVIEEPAPVSAASFFREPEPYRAPPPPPMPPMGDRLVSDTVAAASTAAFASFSSRRRLASDFPMGNGAATLEELTCHLLRPMLREWLDANLPSLVERLVHEEVQRIASEAR